MDRLFFRRVFVAMTLAAAAPVVGLAQEEQAPPPPGHDMAAHHATMQRFSPYSGEQERRIKAISDAEREGLLGGHGMGFAKAAELNHYPGPRHVLELAAELDLSPGQRQATQASFDAMQGQATALGERILEGEVELDTLFGDARADEASLTRLVSEIGRLRGALRLVHLRAHLEMRALLRAEQIAAYHSLRGYSSLDDAGR